MLGDKGQAVTDAGPSTPVEVLGLDGVPDAGEIFNVVSDEKAAKALAEHRHDARRKKELAGSGRVSLENILDKIKSGEVKEVKVVLKADVQGSIEAVANALTKLSTDNVGVNVISTGVGGITESDVSLAKASSAVVIGFNVRPAGKAQQLAEQEGVDIKLYQVIYDAIDDVKKAMVGMLAPIMREKVLGKAEVRQVFNIPKAGTIARQLRHRREDHAQGAAAAGARLGRHLHGQGRLAAAVQGRRLRGRAGLRVRSVDRGLRRPQGRRRHRGVRGRVRGADARKPGRRRQAFLARCRVVTVAIARVTLFLGESHSLKEKRMVLRRIKDLVRNKFNVSIAEVSENDAGSGRCWACRWSAAIGASRSRRWTRCCASSAATSRSRTRRRSCRSFGDELVGPDFKHWEE